MARRPKILVVDDLYPQLVALEAILGDLGQVVTATSGEEALRKLMREEYAVILLDVRMPGMDGFETAQLIRSRRRHLNTPILFLTAYPDELAVTRAYSLGAVDYVLTPVLPEVLRSKVRVFVQLYRTTSRIRRQAIRLRKRTAQLSAMASQLIQVEDRERARLAQILHDHVQQLLAATAMRVQMARQQVGEGDAGSMLAEAEELLAQSIGTARSLSVELHPPILDSGGLAPAVAWLGRHFRKHFRLPVEIHCAPESTVPISYRILLFDAIRELLLNVVKHSGASSARVEVRADDAGAFLVSVEDDGMGFDPARITGVESNAEHRGLRSLTEKLEALRGDLRVVSAPSRGARIEVRLPVQTASDRPERRPPERAPQPGIPTNAIRVLLADDHEILRKGLKSLLQRYSDIEVVGEASDGVEAIELARRLSPQVIVMDLSMPRLNGIDATRTIVGESPDTRVIGLSMKDASDAMSAMLAAGAVCYLTKGGPPADLVSAIRASVEPAPPAGEVRPEV